MSYLSFKLYAFLTILSVALAIYNSYNMHQHFYPTVIHLSQNKVNRTIFINFFLMVIIKILVTFVTFTFGELREIERLSVIERAKRKIIDIALMLLIFREDLDIYFIIMMIKLISLSFIHWIAIKRSEYLIAENQMKIRLHLKLILCFFVLAIVDYYICQQYYILCFNDSYSLKEDAKFQDVVFGFEFLIMTFKIVLPFIKYIINLFEILTYSHFESKPTYFSVLDFGFTLTKLGLQLMLINFIRLTYGLPLYLIGDAIENIIGIFKAFKVFIRSCYLVYMIKKIDDVEGDEIAESDTMCLICLDEIIQGKKLSCGHVFHTGCLRTWIQGNPNQFCPKCKTPINFDFPRTRLNGRGQSTDSDEPSLVEQSKNALSNNIIVAEIQETKNTMQVYENVQQLRQLYSHDNQQQDHFQNDLGSVAFGLPTEANYRVSLKNEVKRLQIKLMNQIIMGVESGVIDPSVDELVTFCETYTNIEKVNQVANPIQQEIQKVEEEKECVEEENKIYNMMHEAAFKRFQSQTEDTQGAQGHVTEETEDVQIVQEIE